MLAHRVGKADTILQAMEQIEKDGPESMKADARYHINYGDQVLTDSLRAPLVHLVDKFAGAGRGRDLAAQDLGPERQNW